MDVRRIDQQTNALAPVRRLLAAVDSGHDLLSGDQLVLGDTRQSAVDERIGAQLLHDADIDRDALAILGMVVQLEILRPDSQHEVLLV